jgi:hypothetical protein
MDDPTYFHIKKSIFFSERVESKQNFACWFNTHYCWIALQYCTVSHALPSIFQPTIFKLDSKWRLSIVTAGQLGRTDGAQPNFFPKSTKNKYTTTFGSPIAQKICSNYSLRRCRFLSNSWFQTYVQYEICNRLLFRINYEEKISIILKYRFWTRMRVEPAHMRV